MCGLLTGTTHRLIEDVIEITGYVWSVDRYNT